VGLCSQKHARAEIEAKRMTKLVLNLGKVEEMKLSDPPRKFIHIT